MCTYQYCRYSGLCTSCTPYIYTIKINIHVHIYMYTIHTPYTYHIYTMYTMYTHMYTMYAHQCTLLYILITLRQRHTPCKALHHIGYVHCVHPKQYMYHRVASEYLLILCDFTLVHQFCSLLLYHIHAHGCIPASAMYTVGPKLYLLGLLRS
jgi:hypothetical protein